MGKVAESVYPSDMPDVEKSLDASPSTAENLLSQIGLRKSSSNDANSSEITEKKSAKEKKDDIKNYFVSDESDHLCCIELNHRW